MKKTICLMVMSALILGLAACSSRIEETAAQAVTEPVQTQTAAETEAPSQEAETEAAPEADMANPMTEVTDPAVFGVELGIDIDSGLLFSDAKMFIIDGRVAECQFSFENVMGETVDCTLRATRDETVAQNLHGIYDSTLKEVNSIGYPCDGGTFTVRTEENDAQDTAVYTWKVNDTWYSMVFKGKPSQMEVAEAMDSVMFATGIETDSFSEEETKEETTEKTAEETAGIWYELTQDNEILTVRLKGNVTTGYEWTCKIRDEGSLELISEEYKEDAHEKGLVGVGGVWTASFRAAGPDGRSNYESPCGNEVAFTYSRNWEAPVPPSKVIDLNITGAKLEITGVHEPDFSAPAAEDGEYNVTLEFTDMIEENELSFHALAGIPETVTFTDEEVKNAKPGDVISLSDYGLDDVKIDRVEKLDDKMIEITDCECFTYRDDLGAWVITGLDDDVYRYNREYRYVHFTNETEIDDGMEEILKTGDSGTIYDKMRTYRNVDAKITVKGGEVSRIVIYYHP